LPESLQFDIERAASLQLEARGPRLLSDSVPDIPAAARFEVFNTGPQEV
jgi:hypothetical protein